MASGGDAGGAGEESDKPGMSDIVRATLDSSASEFADSLGSLHREPCFREALMWGMGLGVAFALHRFKQSGNPIRAANTFVTATGIVSAGSWTMCRKNEVDKALETREHYSGDQYSGDPFGDADKTGGVGPASELVRTAPSQ